VAFFDKPLEAADPLQYPDVAMGMEDVSGPNAALRDRAENAELAAFVQERFRRSRDSRRPHENRWLEAYRNYIGVYSPDMQFTETEKCRIFVKVTKTKVLAAYGQVADVLFAAGRIPIGIQPSPEPIGVADAVHFDPKEPPGLDHAGDTAGSSTLSEDDEAEPSQPEDIYGWEGDGREIPPGATAETLRDMLGPLKGKLESLEDKLKPGPGQTPTSATFYPAAEAARKMEKRILDQLEEAEGDKHLRYVAFESVLLGTGVLYGPFSVEKEYPRWTAEGEYKPVKKLVPKIEADTIWNFYPDPDARTPSDMEYFVRRRKMSRTQLRALKRRPFFRHEVIEQLIAEGPNYTPEYWEDALYGVNQDDPPNIERWEVLEYWGLVDAEIAKDAGLDIPAELEDHDELQLNVWVSGGHIIRAVLNPFLPVRHPVSTVPFELNPYSIFGIGVAENMADTQQLMNGFMRMAVDNGVLSGNVVWEIDEAFLTTGQEFKIYPGKIFRRQSGPPGQGIHAHKFPNTTQENLMMFDKARQLADEATGIPSYSHGQTGIMGLGRTAAGISMLMGAASINTKTVIKNFDDYLLMPLGKALFAWNMQFNFDSSVVGDLEVVARGTTSLLKNEARQQRLMTFLQIVSNPALAPFAKFPYIIREIATVLELDPDKVCNSPEEAMRQAEIMRASGALGRGGDQGAAPPGAIAADPTGAGGGNIGIGQAPTPGEQGFAGNAQMPPPQGLGPEQPAMAGAMA